MHYQKLDLNLLVALDVLLHEANIGKAAARLHLSQSSTSGALARLRAYFDDPLLVLVGRRMELTPRAQVLRDAVHDLLLRVDATITARPSFDPQTHDREFRLSLSDYTLHTLMPEVHRVLARAAPRVRLRLLPQVREASLALEHGEVDLLIIPEPFQAPQHPWEALLEERFVSVVWSESALAQGPLTEDRYARAQHVLMVPQGEGDQSYEDVVLRDARIGRTASVVCSSFTALPALVVGTERIATLQERLAVQAARHLPVVVKEPPRAIGMRQGVQWHRFRSDDPGIRWLVQMLREASRSVDD
ncbi:LysR family transcriptional regulator [Variovorax sp. LT1R16]|uniref:LysR family transcriptional regulator n=1 Tax=Variovorax sp. LT1R16 TaxID=3443728 RepID=UPI003F46F0CA